MMKGLKSWLVLTMAVALLIFAFAPKAMAESETLTIKGDGVEKEITYSRADLEGLADVMEQHCYSVANNFPTHKTEYAAGIPLQYLLQQAGLKEEAQIITFIASDTYSREFTVEELLQTSRYYFPADGEKQAVPAMVCFKGNADSPDKLEPIDLTLIMGQRMHGEQTNPWFVKYLSTIEVSCKQPEQWQEVTFDRVAGAEGVTLRLLHQNIDAVKIHYTTDGTPPTLESAVYNISASYYQPQLNQPLLLDKTTVVQAVAIGAGKKNSAVSSIKISFNDALFSDLAGFEWAGPAIEALASGGIVGGVGDYRFDPAGSLTRGMFVTMLGRALNKEAVTAPALSGEFADVDYASWYGPHVLWAVGKGIVSGYPDGTFKPGNSLTVEEMIAMAVRAKGLRLEEDVADKALAGVSDWAKPYIWAAYNNSLLAGEHLAIITEDDITVAGQKQANRAEAAVMLYQLLQVSGQM